MTNWSARTLISRMKPNDSSKQACKRPTLRSYRRGPSANDLDRLYWRNQSWESIAAVLLHYSVEWEGSIGGGTSHGRDHGPLSSSATFVRIYHRLPLQIFRETVHLPSFFYFYLIPLPLLSSLSRKPLLKYKRASLQYWQKDTSEKMTR